LEAGESNSGGTIDIESAFANGIEPGIDSVLLGCGRTKDAVRVGDVC
jgi:hypothetical protein